MEPGAYYQVRIPSADLEYLIDLVALMSEVPNLMGDTTGAQRSDILVALNGSTPEQGTVMLFSGFMYLLDLIGDSPDEQDQRITALLDEALDRPAYLVV